MELYGRHYCSTCHQRVYPYDGFEAMTMAPEKGASGKPILLSSYNQALSKRGLYERLGWCWTCDAWVSTYRLTRADLALMYARRAGVRFRGNGRSEARLVREIEERMEARNGRRP